MRVALADDVTPRLVEAGIAEVARDVERVREALDHDLQRRELRGERVGRLLREVRVGALVVEIVDDPRGRRHVKAQKK